jgi:hypothetical protein
MKLTVQISALPDRSTFTGCVNGRSLAIDRCMNGARSGDGATYRELLCLAVGAGYADELLREAEHRGIRVDRAHVVVEAETETGGRKPGHLAVSVRVETNADEPAIMELIEHTDRVSEVLKSLRLGTPVRLADAQRLAKR